MICSFKLGAVAQLASQLCPLVLRPYEVCPIKFSQNPKLKHLLNSALCYGRMRNNAGDNINAGDRQAGIRSSGNHGDKTEIYK